MAKRIITEKTYQINEIANILGISKELIRYYEKKNIISPKRSETNNYREYSNMDFFILCEMLQLKEWDISLKEIAKMKADRYTDELLRCYHEKQELLDREIRISQIKKIRLQSLIDQLESCKMNIGNYWVEKSPSGYWFEMMDAQGDVCGPMKIYENNEASIYNPSNFVFMDCLFISHDDYSEWGMFLNEKYLPAVSCDVRQAVHYKEREMCFCTIADMGEPGRFSEKLLDEVGQVMTEKGFKQIGNPRGVIIARGMEDNNYKRFIKVMIPIEKA